MEILQKTQCIVHRNLESDYHNMFTQLLFRLGRSLRDSCEPIAMLGTQLSVVASVKAVCPEKHETDDALVTNARNLLEAVSNTLTQTEACCIKVINTFENLSNLLDQLLGIVSFHWMLLINVKLVSSNSLKLGPLRKLKFNFKL